MALPSHVTELTLRVGEPPLPVIIPAPPYHGEPFQGSYYFRDPRYQNINLGNTFGVEEQVGNPYDHETYDVYDTSQQFTGDGFNTHEDRFSGQRRQQQPGNRQTVRRRNKKINRGNNNGGSRTRQLSDEQLRRYDDSGAREGLHSGPQTENHEGSRGTRDRSSVPVGGAAEESRRRGGGESPSPQLLLTPMSWGSVLGEAGESSPHFLLVPTTPIKATWLRNPSDLLTSMTLSKPFSEDQSGSDARNDDKTWSKQEEGPYRGLGSVEGNRRMDSRTETHEEYRENYGDANEDTQQLTEHDETLFIGDEFYSDDYESTFDKTSAKKKVDIYPNNDGGSNVGLNEEQDAEGSEFSATYTDGNRRDDITSPKYTNRYSTMNERRSELKTLVLKMKNLLTNAFSGGSQPSTLKENNREPKQQPTSYHYQSYAADSPFLVKQDNIPANEKYEDISSTFQGSPGREYVEFTERDAIALNNKQNGHYLKNPQRKSDELGSVFSTDLKKVRESQDEEMYIKSSSSNINEQTSRLTEKFGVNAHDKYVLNSYHEVQPLPADILHTTFQAEDNQGDQKANLFLLKRVPEAQAPITYIKYTTEKSSAPLFSDSGKYLPSSIAHMFDHHTKTSRTIPDEPLESEQVDHYISKVHDESVHVMPFFSTNEDNTAEQVKPSQPEISYNQGVYFIPREVVNRTVQNETDELEDDEKLIHTPDSTELEDLSTYVSFEQTFDTTFADYNDALSTEINSPNVTEPNSEMLTDVDTSMEELTTHPTDVEDIATDPIVPPATLQSNDQRPFGTINDTARGGIFMNVLQTFIRNASSNETLRDALSYSIIEAGVGDAIITPPPLSADQHNSVLLPSDGEDVGTSGAFSAVLQVGIVLGVVVVMVVMLFHTHHIRRELCRSSEHKERMRQLKRRYKRDRHLTAPDARSLDLSSSCSSTLDRSNNRNSNKFNTEKDRDREEHDNYSHVIDVNL